MASIQSEIVIDVDPETAWDALRDYGAVHERIVPGFVLSTELDGRDRIVTFFNQAVARERIVTVDDEHRRLVWSVIEGSAGLEHHNASAQVQAVGAGQIRFVWIADVLPDDAAPTVRALMERAMPIIKQTLERPPA